MRLPKSSVPAKLSAFLACSSLSVFIVGFASPYWLQKSFNFPLHKAGVDELPVTANVGLFTACKVEYYRNGNSNENCSPEGAADWQIVSAAMAIAGLVFGLVGTVLSVLSVVTYRLVDNMKAKLAILVCNFIVCCFLVGPLIMFPANKTIIVKPTVSNFQVDFDLGWSYQAAGASVWMFALLELLLIEDIVWSCDSKK